MKWEGCGKKEREVGRKMKFKEDEAEREWEKK